MTHAKPVDLPASIRQRLLNLAKKSEEDFTLVLTTYAAERLLYRLSRSPFASQFALKGAMLTSDVEMSERIRSHPLLQWTALNVRSHRRG